MRGEVLLQVAAAFAAAALYFLPAILSDRHGRLDKLTIALYNALFGWTVIGWAITLYWAYQPNPAADLVPGLIVKRRALSMRTFSTGLVERVQRRIAMQERSPEKHSPH